jgi:tape measure domain-containing protein
MASGALRGDEFNSVNEQGNRLMIALADSMGSE